MKNPLLLLLFLIASLHASAQPGTQTISGTLTDEASHSPLAGASIALVSNPGLGTTTDMDGHFRLQGVPLGRQSVRISYIGYEERLIPDIVVTAGKEIVLNLTLQEGVNKLAEVQVSYNRAKDKTQTVNEMALVSARSFNIDDTRKYAGALGDPSRMAANFAGVVSGDDSRNDIVVRGNSPTGMLWQLDGLSIPNPNHFGTLNSTGGPVSMLNNNAMDKSDFLTSAYPAQYGNALAGVFDIRTRNGNTEKHEAVAQVGFNGFELGAEGPISRKTKSSYLINYRYSTLGIFQSLGIQFGTGTATPIYQDVNYKFQMAVGRKGNLSLFGLAGTSKIDFVASDSDTGENNLYSSAYQNAYPRFATTITGLAYQHQISEKTSTRITLGYSTTYQRFTTDSISYLDRSIVLPGNEGKFITEKASAVWSVAHKFNRKTSLQAGVSYDYTHFNIFSKSYEHGITEQIHVNTESNFGLAQSYAQVRYRLNSKLTFVGGLHAQYITINDAFAIEPRINARYAINAHHAIGLGYGLNHQAQSIYTYYVQTPTASGIDFTNQHLGFTRSNQYVITHDWNAAPYLRIKTEAYYQYLSKVPVTRNPSSFSALNTGASFAPSDEDSLVNEGTGTNYGAELTVERFFHHGFYFLITGSLFDSKYKASNGMESNTAFNTGYAANVLGGKEFIVGRHGNVFTMNIKLTTIGGRYFTPVDEEASKAKGYLVEDNTRPYSERQKPYFRTDLKISYRKEYRHSTLEFALDLQNLTNNKNVFSRGYDPRTQKIYYNYQQSFFPVPFVRFTF